MVEWTKAPHWKCGVGQLTEGSNPSLSAIFFAKKWRNEDVSLLSYERLFVKFYLRKNRKKVDNYIVRAGLGGLCDFVCTLDLCKVVKKNPPAA